MENAAAASAPSRMVLGENMQEMIARGEPDADELKQMLSAYGMELII